MLTGHLGLGSDLPKWVGPGKGSHRDVATLGRHDVVASVSLASSDQLQIGQKPLSCPAIHKNFTNKISGYNALI